MEGWVSIYRSLATGSLWLKQKFTKGQAWVDLILLANHKDGIIEKRGNQIPIKRGQVGWSELALSCRWKWSRNKTTRFLKWLENEKQIIQQRERITTLITVVNYDKYQMPNNKTKQQKIQQKDNRTLKTIQQKDTNNNDNNINNENNNIYSLIISYLNEKADRNYKDNTPKTRGFIKARIAEGFTIDDFKKVIDTKVSKWKADPKMQDFLRPETLFGTKFESYLNEKINKKEDWRKT